MVSPTGQFIVPCTIPGTLLVNFITNHLQEATERNFQYQRYMNNILLYVTQIFDFRDKHLERDLIKKCRQELNLAELNKEDNITPDLMIKFSTKLLECKHEVLPYTTGLHMNISTYYSVLSDGVTCIPWNFQL